MSPRKWWLLLYLAIWSTIAARLAFEFVFILIPKRGDFAQMVNAVPFIAFPGALGIAFLLLRKDGIQVSKALGRYSWIVPLLLYFAILFFIAVATGPVGFLIVLVFGFLFGLPALLIGIPLHLIGLLPLIYFEDRFFARRGDRSQ